MLRKLIKKVLGWFGKREDVRQEKQETQRKEAGKVIVFPDAKERQEWLSDIEQEIQEQERVLEWLRNVRKEELRKEFMTWKDNVNSYDSLVTRLRREGNTRARERIKTS